MDREHTQSKVDSDIEEREHEVHEGSEKSPTIEQIEQDFSMMRAIDTYKRTGKYPIGMSRTKKGLLRKLADKYFIRGIVPKHSSEVLISAYMFFTRNYFIR